MSMQKLFRSALAGVTAFAGVAATQVHPAGATEGLPCSDSYNLITQHNTGRRGVETTDREFDNLDACIQAICGGRVPGNGHGFVVGQYGFISADCFNKRTGGSDASAAVPIDQFGTPFDVPVTYTFQGHVLPSTPPGCPEYAGDGMPGEPPVPYKKKNPPLTP